MIRVFVLVIVTAVLANAQCYNACATADSYPSESSSPNSCHHHHQQSPPTGGVCQHQHASVTSPDNPTGLSKQDAAASSSLIAILGPQELSISQQASDPALVFQDTSPPGAQTAPSSTILRI
jgi:hypothetical protein